VSGADLTTEKGKILCRLDELQASPKTTKLLTAVSGALRAGVNFYRELDLLAVILDRGRADFHISRAELSDEIRPGFTDRALRILQFRREHCSA
jgi:hypothetical protein